MRGIPRSFWAVVLLLTFVFSLIYCCSSVLAAVLTRSVVVFAVEWHCWCGGLTLSIQWAESMHVYKFNLRGAGDRG